jgi:hypothetical protein
MKRPHVAGRPRTIRPWAGRRKKEQRASANIAREVTEFSNVRSTEQLPLACVDMAVTRRYSPESF